MHAVFRPSKPMLLPTGGFLTLQRGGPAWPPPEPLIQTTLPDISLRHALVPFCSPSARQHHCCFLSAREKVEKQSSEVRHFIIVDQDLLRHYDLIVSAACLHPKTRL